MSVEFFGFFIWFVHRSLLKSCRSGVQVREGKRKPRRQGKEGQSQRFGVNDFSAVCLELLLHFFSFHFHILCPISLHFTISFFPFHHLSFFLFSFSHSHPPLPSLPLAILFGFPCLVSGLQFPFSRRVPWILRVITSSNVKEIMDLYPADDLLYTQKRF